MKPISWLLERWQKWQWLYPLASTPHLLPLAVGEFHTEEKANHVAFARQFWQVGGLSFSLLGVHTQSGRLIEGVRTCGTHLAKDSLCGSWTS